MQIGEKSKSESVIPASLAEEVGQDFEVTRQRIREIEAKALAKLRAPGRSERLQEFVDDEDEE